MATEVPALRYKIGSTVVPGDRLANIRTVSPGNGTFATSNGHIYACMVGSLTVTPAPEPHTGEEPNPAYEVSINPRKAPFASQALHVGQLVVGKIARISPQNAIMEISLGEGVGPISPSEGAIRMEDIRTGATEQLVIGDCFQPGDLVVARVISLGDSRRAFLSTAEPELGVIRAKRNGVTMIPSSWKEMECPQTGVIESRKCAKPLTFKRFQANSNS